MRRRFSKANKSGRRKVSVPNLSGRTRSQAQSDLNAINLNYSESSTNTSDSGLSNSIQSQGTAANTVVLFGDTVSFVYYNYVAPPPPPPIIATPPPPPPPGDCDCYSPCCCGGVPACCGSTSFC